MAPPNQGLCGGIFVRDYRQHANNIALWLALFSILWKGDLSNLPELSWNNYLAMMCILVALVMSIWMILRPSISKQDKSPTTRNQLAFI